MSIIDKPIYTADETFTRGYNQGRLDAVIEAKRAVEVAAFVTHANDRPETRKLFEYTLLQLSKMINPIES